MIPYNTGLSGLTFLPAKPSTAEHAALKTPCRTQLLRSWNRNGSFFYMQQLKMTMGSQGIGLRFNLPPFNFQIIMITVLKVTDIERLINQMVFPCYNGYTCKCISLAVKCFGTFNFEEIVTEM